MKNTSFVTPILIVFIVVFSMINSCKEKTEPPVNTPEQENVSDASEMDFAIGNMIIYNDSVQSAVMHAPGHVHHYDSIYHHHDSVYIHHHDHYHHGDTTHHHTGFHHTATQHHQHDSIANAHHNIAH